MQKTNISFADSLGNLSDVQDFLFGNDLKKVEAAKKFPNHLQWFIKKEKNQFIKLFKNIETAKLSNPDYFSILGDCIDQRKQFIFQCNDKEIAEELSELTMILVFQHDYLCKVYCEGMRNNDKWRVFLDGLSIIAIPPNQED